MRSWSTRLLFAFIAVLLSSPATPATLAGVNLPDRIDVAGNALQLNGVGLRKKLFIKVYVGGLYLPNKEQAAEKILANDSARQVVMHFLYSVSKDQMCEAWEEGLEANVPNASPDVKKGFATLCAWMEPIPKGNRLVMSYVPGTGTTVEINGKAKGTIPGKGVSDAILGTWIGPKPGPGDDFKDDVLGK